MQKAKERGGEWTSRWKESPFAPVRNAIVLRFNWPPGLFKLFSKNVPNRLSLLRFPFTLPSPFHSIHSPSPSQPASLVSRSQAKTLMELFYRTISRANSAFFIEHCPFGLPWNYPRRNPSGIDGKTIRFGFVFESAQESKIFVRRADRRKVRFNCDCPGKNIFLWSFFSEGK